MTTPEQHPLEFLASNGPHEIIYVADERAKPMTDMATFVETVRGFTRDDYYLDGPYEYLVRSSQYSWNQYDQFAAVLMEAAVKAGADRRSVRDYIGWFRYMFVENEGEARDIVTAIKCAAQDKEQADKVSVLSIPCGSGKSTALTRLIGDVLERNNGEGLIIVTDSVDRMKEYWKPDTHNPAFDDVLLHFIKRHEEQVAVMNRDNYDSMRRQQWHKPVVVLTTQRYFSWTQGRVKDLLRWEGGRRPLIIFDEAPYLSVERDVTAATINKVAAALRMGIEATDDAGREAKEWAITFWEDIRAKLLSRMDELEYMPELQYACIGAEETEGLEAFLDYVRENRSKLDTDKDRIVDMVEDVVRLLKDWGVYSHRGTAQSGLYESKYTVHVDHRDLVTGLDAKVIVLDGTATVSPMYDEDYVYMSPTRDFIRSLAYLTIRICDVPTGESELRGKTGETAKMIRGYLSHATGVDHDLVIFSSKKMEDSFRAAGFDNEHTGHFNNIKGLNSYSRAVNIAQVGLNRKPPIEYLTLDLARNDDVREQLIADTATEGYIAAMSRAREALDYSRETMTRHVLADMEQNMYRGVIRNAANTKPYTYYVFFEHDHYQQLIAAVKERYEPLGATVELVSRETVEAYRPQGTESARVAAIAAWLDHWDGTPIRQSKVYKKLGMERPEFNNALASPAGARVKAQIDEAKQNAKAAGLKTGWLLGKSVSSAEPQ
ncbi:MAG: DEAD/DEAH box helicase family protein [Clostridia bacterium]|nr:DEAD/DEAH box helicase family protein [Clostridia bacterium]